MATAELSKEKGSRPGGSVARLFTLFQKNALRRVSDSCPLSHAGQSQGGRESASVDISCKAPLSKPDSDIRRTIAAPDPGRAFHRAERASAWW